MITQNRRLAGILLGVAFLMLIPFIAMQFSNEVNWSFFDFIVAGGLLLSTGLVCEWVLRKVDKKQNRILLVLGILVALLLIWAELAVGLFGSPIAGS